MPKSTSAFGSLSPSIWKDTNKGSEIVTQCWLCCASTPGLPRGPSGCARIADRQPGGGGARLSCTSAVISPPIVTIEKKRWHLQAEFSKRVAGCETTGSLQTNAHVALSGNYKTSSSGPTKCCEDGMEWGGLSEVQQLRAKPALRPTFENPPTQNYSGRSN